MKIKEKKKIALVLSGGGIKAAAFHIGVCLALKEKGFRFIGGTPETVRRLTKEDDSMAIRLYVGSSAGSFVSSVLASGYTIESLVNAFEVGLGYNKIFNEFGLNELKPLSYRHMFSINAKGIIKSVPHLFKRRSVISGGLESLLKHAFSINGVFTTAGVEAYLRKHVLPVNEFDRLGVELFVIGTQLNHSRKVIFGNFDEVSKDSQIMYSNIAKISEAVAASASLPPVFAPYGIKQPDGKEMFFFDGEIRDTLSTHVAVDHGADLVISSYSVQPYHYTPEMGSLHQYGIPVIINQALYQVIQQKIEKHIEHQQEIRAIYNTVEGYLRQAHVEPEHRRKILEIIEKKVSFKPNVDYMYIHPRPQNYEMFFVDHFSLNPKIMAKIAKIGFKSAISTMRKYGL
jgi:predicted acylesterase/phospholipase RssA